MEENEIDELVRKHFEAIKSKDIDSFMDGWDDNASIEFLLSGNTFVGKENLKKIFQEQLFNPDLGINTQIRAEIRYKNFRTYIEQITESSEPSLRGLEIHWTIEFKDGKIHRVWTLQ